MTHRVLLKNLFQPSAPVAHPKGSSLRRLSGRMTRLAIFGASLAFMGKAHAVDATWNTGTGSYHLGSNWVGGTAPAGASVATFSNSGAGTVTIVGNLGLKGITYTANASAYTLSQTDSPYIEFNDGTIQTTGTGANSQNITATLAVVTGLVLSSGYTSPSHVLNISGAVYGRAGLTNTVTLTGANTGANKISGVISNTTGTTAITKSGAGTWVLSGVNTYTGATQVNQGLLLVTGTHSGAYTVNGGQLGGAGGKITATGITLGSAAGSGINVSGAGLGTVGSQNGVVATGTLELVLGGGSLNISQAGNSSLTFALNTPGNSDQVKLTTGTLNIGVGALSLASFNFDISNWEPTGAQGTYNLFTTSSPGGITGSLASSNLTGIWGGYNVTLTQGFDGGGNAAIQLVVVPEPSTLHILGAGLLVGIAAVLRRRKNGVAVSVS